MPSGSIEQPLAKLSRAVHHYRVIKYDIFGGYDRQAWPVTPERHRDGLEYRLRAGYIEPLPPDLPLIFGDAYFNLRAALDHLVYQMHVRHFRGRIPVPVAGQPDIARQSAFPILDAPRTDPASNWREIRHLARSERAAIERLQPYQRGGRARMKWRRGILRDVNRLNNIDKHRELHIARNMVQSLLAPQFAPELGFRYNPAFGVTLEPGAYIGTWTFAKPPPPEQVDVELSFIGGVGIEPGGDKIEAIPHLGACLLAIQEVIGQFSHLFPPSAEPLDLSWIGLNEPPY